jgi:hypothetical protein
MSESPLLHARLRFRRLSELAPKLNQTTDETNLAIKAVEEYLKRLALGITAEVEVESIPKTSVDADGEVMHYHDTVMLSFERHGPHSAFRVVVKRVVRDAFEAGQSKREVIESITPLAECPRQEKLRGVPHLLPLLEKIAERAEAINNDASKAAKSLADMLPVLPLPAPPPPPAVPLNARPGGVVGRFQEQFMGSLLEAAKVPPSSLPSPSALGPTFEEVVEAAGGLKWADPKK